MNPTTTPVETPAPVDAKTLNAQFRAQNPAIELEWEKDKVAHHCDECHTCYMRGIDTNMAEARRIGESWEWDADCGVLWTTKLPESWLSGPADSEETAKDLAELAFWRAITGAQNQL